MLKHGTVGYNEWFWDILKVTWFGVERSKVKVTRSITLHNDISFQAATALHPHSLGGNNDKNNTAWARTLWVHSSLWLYRCRSLATLSTSDQQPMSARGVRHLSSNAISPSQVGVSVLTDAECRRLAGLTRRQRRVCRRNAENMGGVRHGAQMAIDECQHQFRHRRWNCSVIDRVNVFGKVVTAGTIWISVYEYLCTPYTTLPRHRSSANIIGLHCVSKTTPFLFFAVLLLFVQRFK